MRISDLCRGRYALHIDDPSLYASFVNICHDLGYCWCSGGSFYDEPHYEANNGDLMIYTSLPHKYIRNLTSKPIFMWGSYRIFSSGNTERHKSRKFIKISDLEDFQPDSHLADMSDLVDTFIAPYLA